MFGHCLSLKFISWPTIKLKGITNCCMQQVFCMIYIACNFGPWMNTWTNQGSKLWNHNFNIYKAVSIFILNPVSNPLQHNHASVREKNSWTFLLALLLLTVRQTWYIVNMPTYFVCVHIPVLGHFLIFLV